MKPATKKTIIIIVAVLIVALIVWLVFFRKKDWEKEIDSLESMAEEDKEKLRAAVMAVLKDPTLTNNVYLEAQEMGIPKARWLVVIAAQSIGWPAGVANGKLKVVAKKS